MPETRMQPQPRFEIVAEPPRVPLAMRAAGLTSALVAIVIIGVLDHASGADIGFSLFYLMPVVACGWWLGTGAGIATAIVASISWFLADVTLHSEDYAVISLWNGLTRLGIFLGMGTLTARVRLDSLQKSALNTRLKEVLDKEARLARTDALTGLLNSRAMLEILRTEIARSRRAGHSLCLAYLDVDNFKRINDTRGHRAGDEYLARLATGVREVIRAADVPARVGGDEFAVLFWNTPPEEAARVCGRIIRRAVLLAASYPDCEISASAGVAHFRIPPPDPEDVIQRADAAMYRAKSRGKGRVEIWTTRPRPEPGPSKPAAPVEGKESQMAKVIYCSKVNPASDCDHVIRGKDVEEVLQKAGVHAKDHGLTPSPQLIEKVKAAIEDE